ncbi:MAG: uncharacterized protein A8A55_2371 [Amphiamblys sp. WSBS2006]|nr:MAG: uncharacterized protein A8A55_2371 [Amphiamblys sp. WSBS2006]
MNLKNTTIEDLLLVDEMAVVFFYNSIEKSSPSLCVENLSFGNKSNLKREMFHKLIKRVHEGENVASRNIKMLVLNRNNFFNFLEEENGTARKEIHVEDLFVAQNGKDSGPETETTTKIVVSKKISIKGNACVLLFIELGPEISHLDIYEIQRKCRFPEINIPRINIQLTKNKIIIKENIYVLQILKKNITETEMCFFITSRKSTIRNTKITLAAWGIGSICFRSKGLPVLLSITNKKIKVRQMKVMDTVNCLSREEKRDKGK